MRTTEGRSVAVGGTVVLVAVLTACGGDTPGAPTTITIPDGQYRSLMKATVGAGLGSISITSVANAAGRLDMVVKVRLEGARPNATYLVQRAGESGRANSADGVCQRAAGAAPWSPADPPVNFLFPSFRVPDPGGPEVSFRTLGNGNGSIDFEYVHPTFAAGIPFDMMVRVVDDAASPSSELRSECFTVK